MGSVVKGVGEREDMEEEEEEEEEEGEEEEEPDEEPEALSLADTSGGSLATFSLSSFPWMNCPMASIHDWPCLMGQKGR